MSDADNLDIKKRARRRLVGAIALALLAAVVLPLMMEQEPHQISQDIQISIPDRGDTTRARPIAEDSAAAPAEIPPAPEEEAPSAPGVAASAPPRAATPPPTAAAKAPATPAPTPSPNTGPAPGPAPQSSPAPKAPPPPVRDTQEEARARAALEGRAPPPRAESFNLQIGAFGDEAVANRVAADLKAKGFSAYTEKAGKLTRVRIGPVSGREAADRLAARLKASGHNATVIAR